MYSQYVFVGVPLHTARIACWFSKATTHWSNFCTRDGIDSQTVLRTIRESKMASYGLEAVNEPLEEAASQLSLDSLRDHKNAPYSLNFSRVTCICQEFICLTTKSLWKIDDVSASSFSLAYRRHYMQYNDYSKVLL